MEVHASGVTAGPTLRQPGTPSVHARARPVKNGRRGGYRPRYFIWFTPALGLLLAGYLFFSKTFAYVHLPGTPVFIGEVVMFIGLVEAVRIPSPWRHLLRTAPVLVPTNRATRSAP